MSMNAVSLSQESGTFPCRQAVDLAGDFIHGEQRVATDVVGQRVVLVFA
jgi:hypothetical protein